MDIITVYVATAYFPLRILLFRMIRYPTLSALAAVVAKWSAISVCKVTGTVMINCTEAEQVAVLIKVATTYVIIRGKNPGKCRQFSVFFQNIYYYYYYYYHHHHLLYAGYLYCVAAILLLLFMVLISLVPVLNLLYFYISTFRSMCAVPSMAVFCSSLISCFPGMLPTYFLNDFEIVLVAPIITDITFVFYTPHALYFYCKVFIRIFSASFLITFLSPEIANSIYIHVPFSLSRIIMSDLLLGILLLLLDLIIS